MLLRHVHRLRSGFCGLGLLVLGNELGSLVVAARLWVGTLPGVVFLPSSVVTIVYLAEDVWADHCEKLCKDALQLGLIHLLKVLNVRDNLRACTTNSEASSALGLGVLWLVLWRG